MKKTIATFKEINRTYIITSNELKKKLGIEGEILNINLWEGRSPEDEEKGLSPDRDRWEIVTKEKHEMRDKKCK